MWGLGAPCSQSDSDLDLGGDFGVHRDGIWRSPGEWKTDLGHLGEWGWRKKRKSVLNR